jgi:ribosomal protein L14E/L6E/L27E
MHGKAFQRQPLHAPLGSISSDANARPSRPALQIGQIVLLISGEFKGRQAIVAADEGAGIFKVSGFGVPSIKIDREMVIPIKKIVSVTHVHTESTDNLTNSPI